VVLRLCTPSRSDGVSTDPTVDDVWVATGDRDATFLNYIGVRMLRPDTSAPGEAVVELDMRPDLLNNAGMLQGGLIATLIDCAGGVAASRATKSMKTFTANMNITYLAPGRIGPIRAIGTVLRQGKTTVVTEVRVIDTGADDRLMTVATITFQIPVPRD
jgi:uncharacterized protein (TIGR00369 family)